MLTFDQHPLAEAAARRLDRTPSFAVILRSLVMLGVVVATVLLIHQAPLARPLPGLLSILVMLVYAWFAGFVPSLLLLPLLLLIVRLQGSRPGHVAALTVRELVALVLLTLLSAATGLAGQYRRRIRVITEQHIQRLKDQAQALDQATIVFRDLGGQITQWSEGAERLFGWTTAEACGRLLHELLQTQYPQPLDEIHAYLERHGQWQGEVVLSHKDGRQMHVAAHWILYRDKLGNPIGVAEVHSDVTALRHAEAALREADHRKDEFLAVLAHEIRNPLAPIRSGLELMKMVEDDPELTKETRDIMERQMQQLVMLVDDLLDVSRISRGKLQLRRCQVSLAEVVDSAVEAAMPAIETAGHTLTISLPESPLYLDADPHRLAQVLSNLLDNAAKYTPSAGHISVIAEQRGNEVIVSIKDTGVGISAEMLDRVFDMFTRIERSDGSVQSGLGIGLSLVKSIVEMHGGRVVARSEGAGQGAEFQVILPVMLEAAAPRLTTASCSDTRQAFQRRVLVVDDNRAAADLLGVFVEKLGNQVCVAHDGEEAIDAAGRFRPDVVLMDLGMPKLDGYGAARRIRQQSWGKSIVLVALTGWGQDGDRRRAKEAGFDHHLVKPADPAELRRLLAEPTH